MKSDQDSFRLGGNFCTAVLGSEALRTSGTALDGIAAGKRQIFGSRGTGVAWVIGTKFWGWNLFCGGGG